MAMRIQIIDASAVILAVCAVLLTGAQLKRSVGHDGHDDPHLRKVPSVPELLVGGQAMGPPNAKDTIVEFADFQCPFCAKLEEVFRAFRERHPDGIRIVYRHFPLEPIHPHARTAALASECAAAQGRFERYHNLLFLKQDSIGVVSWSTFAKRAGVTDVSAFQLCLKSKRYDAAITRDLKFVRQLDIRGTPTLIIGGELLEGVPTLDQLESSLRRQQQRDAAGRVASVDRDAP
jgi:protein-disulfide isomerase